MAEVTEHISEHTNVIDVFHDINSVLSGFYQCYSWLKRNLIHGNQDTQHAKKYSNQKLGSKMEVGK